MNYWQKKDFLGYKKERKKGTKEAAKAKAPP
jgi:hypothetical protein